MTPAEDFRRQLYRELLSLPPLPPRTNDQIRKMLQDKEKRRLGIKKATYEMKPDALQDIWWLVDHGGYSGYSHVVNDGVRALARAAQAGGNMTLEPAEAMALEQLAEAMQWSRSAVVGFALLYLQQEARKRTLYLDPPTG